MPANNKREENTNREPRQYLPLVSRSSYGDGGGGNAGAYANNLLGSFSGYGGHHGGGCKKDDNLLELLALGIALMALIQALMMAPSRRRRRRSEEVDAGGCFGGILEGVQDLIWSLVESGNMTCFGTSHKMGNKRSNYLVTFVDSANTI